MRRIDVTKFGMKGDGSLETKALQRIIDEFSLEDTVIYFPKGTYVLSTVHLKDHTHILFEEGANVLGSENFDDYERDEAVDYPLYQDASHSYFHCSLFVGEGVKDISIAGKGSIDMRSVWDSKNVRNMVHRGAKCIALKECKDISLEGFALLHATDLAIYFAGCENVFVSKLKLKVYIDGISPDNSKHVVISDCDILSGDDGIVLKSSYSLNRLDFCRDIEVKSCKISSRCNAIKFGTESNGGFFDVNIHDIEIYNTRITGISIESVDGGRISNINVSNIKMRNVNAPLFVFLGKRLRGPKGSKVGLIENISFTNIDARGPYVPYETIAWNYDSYLKNDDYQDPRNFGIAENIFLDARDGDGLWQFTSNMCGLEESHLKNIHLSNVRLEVEGGVFRFEKEARKTAYEYPEVYAYGATLPASGLYFRYVDGLVLENVTIKTIKKDARSPIVIA